MRLNPNPQQTFLILSMLFGKTPAEREPRFSDPSVKALKSVKFRRELEAAGVVRVERRGRSSHLILEDEAWDFAFKYLHSELPTTPRASKVLEHVLGKLRLFLESHEHSLLDLLAGETAAEPKPHVEASSAVMSNVRTAGDTAVRVESDATCGPPDYERAVREACLALAHGQTRRRVRLKDLREMVRVERTSLDRTLVAMQTAGRLVLYKLDNPSELSPEDDSAALWIAGQPRHLVYLEA
ncbi:MAG TPA: hypothetical protein VFQ61_07985 [Polyangiaceae bacterium]|nr:hypothetical protein [Polyangiaceae bacterium]